MNYWWVTPSPMSFPSSKTKETFVSSSKGPVLLNCPSLPILSFVTLSVWISPSTWECRKVPFRLLLQLHVIITRNWNFLKEILYFLQRPSVFRKLQGSVYEPVPSLPSYLFLSLSSREIDSSSLLVPRRCLRGSRVPDAPFGSCAPRPRGWRRTWRPSPLPRVQTWDDPQCVCNRVK